MNPQIKIVTISLIIIGGLGIVPSIACNDWEWFSRSGSILVLLGAYITWHDYLGQIEHLFSFKKAEIYKEKNNKINNITTNEKGIINKVMKEGVVHRESEDKIKIITKNRESDINKLRYIEITLIVSGTLIWGYGSLLNDFCCQIATANN